MTCREVYDFLMDYLDGELAPPQAAEFERHLKLCPPCVAYLESYRKTIELERSCCSPPEADAAGQVPEELIRAILAARSKSSSRN